MAITDRSHIHKYIVMAIIGRPAVHGHMRSLTAISFTPVMMMMMMMMMIIIIISTPAYKILLSSDFRTTNSRQEPNQREAGCCHVHAIA